MTAELRPVKAEMLVRFGAAAAILGGALRIASSFVPYQAERPWLEGLYGVIDLSLLFGLIGVYLAFADALGAVGFAFFASATAGLASIVGPDSQMFGVDFYRLGALVFVLALGGLGVQLLRRKTLIPAAGLWIAALACALATTVAPAMLMASGVLLGAGYVLAGLAILRPRAS